MKTTNALFKDVLTGLCFLSGTFSFVSGQFVLSTLLFGSASLISNTVVMPKLATD